MQTQFMTDENRAAYEELHRRRRNGEISVDEFIEQAQKIPGSIWYAVDALTWALRRERERWEKRMGQGE